MFEFALALLVTISQPQYEITLYDTPQPLQHSPYSAIWLEPYETLQVTQIANKPQRDCKECFDTWLYAHRKNYESGWIKFEYGEMRLTRIRGENRKVIAQ